MFVEHTKDAYFIHEADTGVILDVSQRACDSLGFTREELIGQSPLVFDPTLTQAGFDAMHAQIRTGQLVRFEGAHRRKDGTTFPVEVLIQRFHHQGRWKTLAVARDVTERHKLEEQLRHAQKLDAVGRLAGGVAHDFNNLLTIILTEAGLMLHEIHAQDPLREDALEIKNAGERAAALTRQLLAFSRRQVLEPKNLDLNTVLKGVEKMLRRLLGEHLSFQLNLASGLPLVLVDPGQFEQVIINLAVNARDAMPTGGQLTIETSRVDLAEGHSADHPGARAGAHVCVSVVDTGGRRPT